MSIVPRIEVLSPGAARVSRTLAVPCTLRIGSSSACDLRVRARGVRARHLALAWDGERLVLVEEDGAGPVRVDGRTVRAPFVVSGSVCIQIGDAEVHATVPGTVDDDPTVVMKGRGYRLHDPHDPQDPQDPTEVPSVVGYEPTDIFAPCVERLAVMAADCAPSPVSRLDAKPADCTRSPLSRLDVWRGRIASTARRTRGLFARPATLVVAVVAVLALAALAVLPRSAGTSKPAARRPTVGAPTTEPSASVRPALAAPAVVTFAPTGTPGTAAALLAGGRRAEARDAYLALAKERPAEPVFNVVARVLAREPLGAIPRPGFSSPSNP